MSRQSSKKSPSSRRGARGGSARPSRARRDAPFAADAPDADPCAAGTAFDGEADVERAYDRAFEPTFADFEVPCAVSASFGSWVRAACDGRGVQGDEGTSPSCVLGRVVRLDRGYPLVATPEGAFRAEHAIALVKGADVRAAVGDWVAVRLPCGHDKARIEHVVPRLGVLARWDGSSRGDRQVLAANLDLLVVVQPFSKRPLCVDRIMRSCVLAREGGARVAVALTKADRVSQPDRLALDVAAVRRAAGDDVDVVVVSCATGQGVEEVRALIAPMTTALLLGESGAGKSTLVNALLGEEVLGVGEVRCRDDQGRHTTVARRMLKVPRAGVLVDAPGLRSLPLLGEERGLACTYPEIDALVATCRFRDCTHGDEPGCAVRAAVSAGSVDAARLEEYRLLAAEMLANRRRLMPSAKASVTQ